MKKDPSAIAKLRQRVALRAKKNPNAGATIGSKIADLNQEALMTLVAIMQDDSNPKMQMDAAKALLDKGMKAHIEELNNEANAHIGEDDIDAAITLAKAVLDELARNKTQKLDGKGAVVTGGASGTDNAAG